MWNGLCFTLFYHALHLLFTYLAQITVPEELKKDFDKNFRLDTKRKLVASDRTDLTTKWVRVKQSFIKGSVSNKLDRVSEDHMVNIKVKKRLSNAM